MLDQALMDDVWSEIFDNYDVDVSTEVFTIIMKYLLDILVPWKKLRVDSQAVLGVVILRLLQGIEIGTSSGITKCHTITRA